MELKIQPLIGLELTLRKVIILTSAFAILITTSIFLYTSLSSSPESFAGTMSQPDQVCYTISDSENKIYKFRLSDGLILDTMTLTGPGAGSPEASTLNVTGDTLFILSEDKLHYVVPSISLANTRITGSDISAQTLTGALGNKSISDFDAMSVDVDGNIWAGSSSSNPSLLVVIDHITGNVIEDFFGSNVDYLVVDNSAYPTTRIDAMAFDPITNQLYANLNGAYDYLFKINTTTGTMELQHQFNTISDVEGMGFDATGELFVVTGSGGDLWKVDIINGEVTLKYDYWGGDPETCDCDFGDSITAVEISGYVFYDANDDTTFNASTEVGVTGFRVDLFDDINDNGIYDAGTDVFVDSAHTYADGYYMFRLNHTTGTEKYVLVSNVSDMPTNNDYTTDNIEVASITVGRQIEGNNNFGFVVGAMHSVNVIKGTVFADANQDTTLQSATEVGVNGVKVYLFEDTDRDGVIDSGEDLLDSAIVGADGKYAFVQNYVPDTVCYITSINQSTVPSSASMTTDNIESQQFTSGGNTSANNNFGLWGGALPVDWLSIDAHWVLNGAEVTWSTASEDNNSHFEIEHTHDGVAWESIGKVTGAGSSPIINNYNFIDHNPYKDINYYRIKQVDFNGDYDYSEVVVARKGAEPDGLTLNIYPNPANDHLFVHWNKSALKNSVQLLDINGKIRLNMSPGESNTTRVNLTNFESGIYFLKYATEVEETVKRLIINH